jgi:hypothetical protein
MANIIIKGRTKIGRTRSEQEINLRKEWGSTMTDEQLDKIKYIERKTKENTGLRDSFAQVIDADKVK